MDFEFRFWAKVDQRPNPTGCLLWAGALAEGYGVVWVGGPKRVTKRAHQVAWEFEHGPVPEGLVLMHSCDVRRCVNVVHLRVGTQQQNLRDMAQKGRAGDTQFRLTPTQREEIVAALREGAGLAELAARYHVTRPAILRMRKRLGLCK